MPAKTRSSKKIPIPPYPGTRDKGQETPESILYSLESALGTKKKFFTPHFYKEK